MKALEQLRQEEEQRRVYRTETEIVDKITPLVDYFGQKYPDTDWRSCCEVVSGKCGKGQYDLAVRHMIRWGKADARVIEDAFQISLPPFIHELYSQMQEAVFIWRNVIRLMPPEEVVAWERQNREWENKEGQPVRLVRFIDSRSYSGDIAVRQSVCDDKWRMYYVSVDDDSDYDDAKMDQYTLAEDLDSWLQYVMANDGAYGDSDYHQEEAGYGICRIN
jgi:hypothetical protein